MSEQDFQDQHSDEVDDELHGTEVDPEAPADSTRSPGPADDEDVDQEELDEVAHDREELAADDRYEPEG